MAISTFRTKYETEIAAVLGKQFGVENRMAVPRVTKITLNVGLSASNKDPKLQETVEKTLSRITGQKPVATIAKKSIAAFKVRENQVVGMKVTLRGARMYHFLDKLVNVTLARVRDFRGISPKVIDKTGNMSIGFKEHIAFPEIRPDEVERLHGIEIVITTNAGTKERGFALMKAFGFPFSADESKKK